MTQYLISSGARALDRIPGQDAPAVAAAAHAAVQEAVNAGAHVPAGGLETSRRLGSGTTAVADRLGPVRTGGTVLRLAGLLIKRGDLGQAIRVLCTLAAARTRAARAMPVRGTR